MAQHDLTDPQVALNYMIAARTVHGLADFAWYDSWFLARYEAARQMLAIVNPGRVDAFEAAFDILRTATDFEVCHLRKVLPENRFASLLKDIDTVPQTQLKSYEKAQFGRQILHDLPSLTALQRELTPLVSKLAGEPVEPCYNFLSLYQGDGRCPPHLDAPSAKWTLDLCLAQSCEWPIHFSRTGPWPTAQDVAFDRLDLAYETYVLHPNEAILFSGSAQWHYRDAIPDAGFCHLAFLHYHPAGCAALVDPSRWAAHFGLPELAVLDSVFTSLRPERRE